MTQVFVSYAHRDKRKLEAFLAEFKPVLDALGLALWFDERITAGSLWDDTIHEAIKKSDIFLTLVTNFAIGSNYMRTKEWPAIKRAVIRRSALSIQIIVDECFWGDHFPERHCIPHSPQGQLKPVTQWRPHKAGHMAAAVACKIAIIDFLKRPPKPPKGTPGPKMDPTPNGVVLKRTPPRKAEQQSVDQQRLLDFIKNKLDSIRKKFGGGGNRGNRHLAEAFNAYNQAANRGIAEIDPAEVWAMGADLDTAFRRIDALPAGERDIDDSMLGDLESLIKLHSTFIMGFSASARLQSRSLTHRALNPDEKRDLQQNTLRMLDGMAEQQGLLAPETREFVKNVTAPLRDYLGDINPEAAASVLEPAIRTGVEALSAVGRAAYANSAENKARKKRTKKDRPVASATVKLPSLGRTGEAATSYLVAEEKTVADFAEGQDDVRRFALGALEVATGSSHGVSVSKDRLAAAQQILDPNFDYEREAARLILAGKAPPQEWVPHIRRLSFLGSNGAIDLSLIAGLSSLQSLDVSVTKVVDLSPISGLSGLTSLFALHTGVFDLSPLAGLSGLTELYVSRTGVVDLSPLAGLSGLTELYVSRTGVVDLSPLAGLSGLTELDVSSTAAVDLSPLAGLSGLHTLDVSRTEVVDLSPLSGLSGLHTLDVSRTEVVDLSPLAGLSGLQTLYVSHTGVVDLSPLAGLSGVQTLYVSNSGVVDLSPLAGFSDLRMLDISNTRISSLTPLSALTDLKTLHVSAPDLPLIAEIADLPKLDSIFCVGSTKANPPDRWPVHLRELVLLGADWPPDVALPDVPYRIDPDGTVHKPDEESSVFFDQWIGSAERFRTTGKLPGET